jgi:hypothetical protein
MTLPPPRNAAPHHEPGDDRTTTEGGTKSPWTEVQLDRTDVRFGSLADICSAKGHVRVAPNNDRESGFPQTVIVRFTPESGHVRCGWGCPLWASSGHRAPRRLSSSTGRLSEYPTDYFVGICIEASAMAEQNPLRLPRVNFSDCSLRLLPLKE